MLFAFYTDITGESYAYVSPASARLVKFSLLSIDNECKKGFELSPISWSKKPKALYNITCNLYWNQHCKLYLYNGT